ncbi:hypothetical protein H6P81_002473 [Aristolochia fimbriata]|uniref:Gnk2-homologous domain-containing protein n=1 Tax=Aristolochia fimbriata TaxID=158543 RepID=A0AAV7F9W0_ARIFI|nr:hypothetical protein H6P81_002473 [Aristolochia fimbriata]
MAGTVEVDCTVGKLGRRVGCGYTLRSPFVIQCVKAESRCRHVRSPPKCSSKCLSWVRGDALCGGIETSSPSDLGPDVRDEWRRSIYVTVEVGKGKSAQWNMMVFSTPVRLMALIGFWAGHLCNGVNGVPNTNLTRVLCNGETYTGGDPFAKSLAYVLDDLEAFAPTAKDRNYYNISPFPIAFAYGHAECVPALSGGDCETCLKSARDTMLTTCVNTIGARAVLYDCNIRYEQYPFND